MAPRDVPAGPTVAHRRGFSLRSAWLHATRGGAGPGGFDRGLQRVSSTTLKARLHDLHHLYGGGPSRPSKLSRTRSTMFGACRRDLLLLAGALLTALGLVNLFFGPPLGPARDGAAWLARTGAPPRRPQAREDLLALQARVADLRARAGPGDLRRAFRGATKAALRAPADLAAGPLLAGGDAADAAAALERDVWSLVRDVHGMGDVVTCAPDPTLPAGDDVPRTLLTGNMNNNEHIMPQFLLSTVNLLTTWPEDRALLALYESGSKDLTPEWLTLLEAVLAAVGAPTRLVQDGAETRWPGQDRIEFLALVRNWAVDPLWSLGLLEPNPHLGGPVTKVAFLNDVYFCPEDVQRLVQHDADVACGMDFNEPKLEELKRDSPELLVGFLAERLRRWLPAAWADRLAGEPGLWKSFYILGPAVRAFYESIVPQFYDTWVARDARGRILRKDAPYVEDPFGAARLAQGLPFPVHCCWNGMIAINAEVFRPGTRFRMHATGECSASECSLFCDDLVRLGFRRAVMDPGVKLSYDFKTARDLHDRSDIPQAPWAAVEAAPPIRFDRPDYVASGGPGDLRNVTCCPLPAGGHSVNFAKCFEDDRIFRHNFTGMALRAAATETR